MTLFQDQCPKMIEEKESMKAIPYAFIVSSLMYAMLRTKPSIHYAIDIVSRYQSNPEQEH